MNNPDIDLRVVSLRRVLKYTIKQIVKNVNWTEKTEDSSDVKLITTQEWGPN